MKSTALCTFATFALASQLPAVIYYELFTEAAAAGGQVNPFLDTVVTDGTNYYSVSRDAGNDDSNLSSWNASTGAISTVMDNATWTAARAGANVLAASNGAAVTSAGNVRFVNFFDNTVYDVSTSTGAVSVVTPASSFGAGANLSAVFEFDSSGQGYAVDSVSDSLFGIASDGTVTTAIDSLAFQTAIGGTSMGGIGILGSSILLGSNSNDSLIAWDTVNGTASTVLTTAMIESVTDDIDGNAGFGDIYVGPDGLVYFYESDSDYILSYDPANPAGTLSVVISEADLLAGPGSDTLNQLSWHNGQLAWTDAGMGFYGLANVVPEPSSALLMLGSGLFFFRRTRK